ncbi:MAG TPA: hypothetical protein VFY10_11625 [Dehalococcoidia bacterium]|nr:hypothetical protein [Dehalococcoidia bacterium]
MADRRQQTPADDLTPAKLWAIAIQVCTPEQLKAGALVWLEGHTSRSAATILGITHGAVQDRLRNARTRIHDHIAKEQAA